MNNLEYACKKLGYQGGTVHQLAKELGVDAMDLLTLPQDQVGSLIDKSKVAKHNEPIVTSLKDRVDVETLDPKIRNWLEELIYMDPRDSEKLFEEIINVLKLNTPEETL